jgi:hypothetical protein
VISSKLGKIEYLVGNYKNLSNFALEPFNEEICEFLSEFSKKLFSNKKIKNFPDLMTLAFWCRKSEIKKIKSKYLTLENRLGLGLAFHITPSNIPTNFAYSLIFGLITGNSNLIKVPSQNFEQIDIICNCINKIITKYKNIKKMLIIVRYKNNNVFTEEISKKCNVRLIWGGDKTISSIKSYITNPKTLDITFPDRYSFSILKTKKISTLTDKSLKDLCLKLYNDTYLVDQNACSSPNLIVWFGNKDIETKERFWKNFYEIVKSKYDLDESALFEKLTSFYSSILRSSNLKSFKKYGNLIYLMQLKKIENDNHNFKGKWGLFYELEIKNFSQIKKQINNKYQTLSYYGFEKKELKNFIFNNHLNGIDRVVPIGKTLDMNIFWDGYDINKILTRVIDIR